MNELSANIRKIKEESGMTAKELSAKSGISVPTLNRILSGKTNGVDTKKLLALSKALGVKITDFVPDNQTKTENPVNKNYGYLRVGAVTPRVTLSDVDKNADAVISAVKKAEEKGVNVLVFPELFLTGYTISDLFYQPILLDRVENAVEELRYFSETSDTLFVVGAPIRKNGKIYNCAVVFFGGEILGVVPKTYIPNYNEFYERRQFSPAPDENSAVILSGKEIPFGKNLIFENENFKDEKIAAEICEDLWAVNSPSNAHAVNGATLILNLSASDELIGKAEYRRSLVSMQSAKTVSAYVYCDAGDGESSTDMVFAGHNVIAENGKILKESRLFQNELIYADVDIGYISYERQRLFNYITPEIGKYQTIKFKGGFVGENFNRKYGRTPFVPQEKTELKNRIDLILGIQSQGLKTRVEKINCKTLVVGLSGGLDSTLAILVAVRAIDALKRSRKDIIAVTMPCFGTTSRTKNNSVLLAESLGVTLKEINITDSVRSHFKDIGQDESVTDVTYENSQARERTQVLMDVANKTGGIVIGTGDLSELALGWATYNGDHMSMYGVNASVPKTLVRFIVGSVADEVGGETGKVLKDILATPVSPELIPAVDGEISQKTEDIVGPYELHDFYLYYFLRAGFAPSKIFEVAKRTFNGVYDEKTIYKWLEIFIKRFFAQQFKRSCLPDGVKVGSVSLSPRGDWRMPSDASVALWLKDLSSVRPTD